MLVLTRKTQESIQIGSDIQITICQIQGNRVRVAISAPHEISIRRSELPVDWVPARETAQVPETTLALPKPLVRQPECVRSH